MAKEETRFAGQCGCFIKYNNTGRGRKGWDRNTLSSAFQYPTYPHTSVPHTLAPFLSKACPLCIHQGPEAPACIPSNPPFPPWTQVLAPTPRCVCNVVIRAGPRLLPTLKFWQIWGGVGADLWENRGLLVCSERKLRGQPDLEMGWYRASSMPLPDPLNPMWCVQSNADSQANSPASHYPNCWDPLRVRIPLPARPLDTGHSENTNSQRWYRWGKGEELGETLDFKVSTYNISHMKPKLHLKIHQKGTKLKQIIIPA